MPPASPDELLAYLDSLGIEHRTVTHPPVFTVEEARASRGEALGGHTKNLFLRDKKGALYLVVAPEDATIELKSLHRLLGASGRFSFGSADLMREIARRGAGLGHALCRHQRQEQARHGHS
jgi:Ala-tRNA(Pro) deacylase